MVLAHIVLILYASYISIVIIYYLRKWLLGQIMTSLEVLVTLALPLLVILSVFLWFTELVLYLLRDE